MVTCRNTYNIYIYIKPYVPEVYMKTIYCIVKTDILEVYTCMYVQRGITTSIIECDSTLYYG